MSFFSEETEPQSQSHTLWAEKYRPNNVNEYICDSHLRDILVDFINRKDIPHLLFHGGAGAGKTTLAKM
jgi:replication factor C small subunit